MKIKSLVSAFVVTLCLSSCSTIVPIQDKAVIKHVISIGRDGEIEDFIGAKGQQLTVNTCSINKIKLDPSDTPLDAISKGILAFADGHGGQADVVLYVHGGLNGTAGALKRAQEKYCLALTDNKYPIFINWRSGPFTTYGDHLSRIRQGEISKIAPLTSPLYLLSDVGNSLINAPKSWAVTGEHSFNAVTKDSDYLMRYKNGDAGVCFTGDKDYSRFKRRGLWFLTAPFKVITTPFVYTMAKPAWDIMLRRTTTPFYTPSDLENPNHNVDTKLSKGSGALSQLITELERVVAKGQQAQGNKFRMNITLVGHSMGAIMVNNLLNVDTSLKFNNIIHMASADSIDSLFEHVLPYLSKHQDARFYSLSLHPENEDREANVLGTIPSGSLLVWIDNMYTSPETVVYRRSGRWDNMVKTLPLIPSKLRTRMAFKIYGLSDTGAVQNNVGLITEPQKHGDFGDLPFWNLAEEVALKCQ